MVKTHKNSKSGSTKFGALYYYYSKSLSIAITAIDNDLL